MVEIESEYLQEQHNKLRKIFNDKKRINVEVMEKLSIEELEQLIISLKKLTGFEFFIDVQFSIRHRNK